MITGIERKFLEIKSLKDLKEIKKPNQNCKVELLKSTDFQLNKFLYKQIGKKHRWIDRLTWTDQKWISYVNDKNVETHILKENEELIGYFELIKYKKEKEIEIAYFGILENYIGNNYGGYLLSVAIKNCFKKDICRAWVHTCSLDHRNALKNYQSRGMRIFKEETLNINTKTSLAN